LWRRTSRRRGLRGARATRQAPWPRPARGSCRTHPVPPREREGAPRAHAPTRPVPAVRSSTRSSPDSRHRPATEHCPHFRAFLPALAGPCSRLQPAVRRAPQAPRPGGYYTREHKSMDGNVRLQVRILAALILLNFIAQIPYYLHLYYFRHHQPPNIVGSLLLGAVFALFVAGYALLAMHKPLGYVLLQTFLAMEF